MLEELEFTTVSSILWNTSPEVGILFMILLIIYLISLLLKNSLLYLTKLRSTREIRAVYTRDNKPRLTLASAYIRGERNHLYECGLHKMRTAGINGSLVKKVIFPPMQHASLGHKGLVYNWKQSMCEHVQQSFTASASHRKRMSAFIRTLSRLS